MDMLRK